MEVGTSGSLGPRRSWGQGAPLWANAVIAPRSSQGPEMRLRADFAQKFPNFLTEDMLPKPINPFASSTYCHVLGAGRGFQRKRIKTAMAEHERDMETLRQSILHK